MEKEDQETAPIKQLRSILESTEQSEDFLLQLTNLFPAIIYVYDADQRKLRYVNRRVTDLLGYTWEDVTTWENDLDKIIFQDDLPLVKEELEKIYQLEGQGSYTYNCRLNHKVEKFRYFKTIGTVLRRNDSGAPLSMLFMAEDITAQMKIEEEKKAANKLIEDTEEMLRIGMWSWDAGSRKTEWSNGMYALMGYSRNEMPVIVEGFFESHICPIEKDQVQQRISAAIENGEEYRLDFSVELRNNSRLYINAIGKPILNDNGEIIKITGFIRDISDQYMQSLEFKANKKLQKQTEQLLNYGVFIWDMQNDVTTWSSGLYDIFEMEPENQDPSISYAWYLQHIVEEDRAKYITAIEACLQEKKNFELEYTIITTNGKVKIVNTKANLVLDNQGLPIRLVGNTRDITAYKKNQIELQRSIRELNRSNLELEDFAYVASHDLHEPLRKITTFGSRLQDRLSERLGEEGTMYINRIQVAAENMRSLIDNLLELSRVSRTKQPFEPVDLNQVLKNVVTDLELTIDETLAKLEISKLPIIDGIPVQLRQMFNNLIGNALKFRRIGVQPIIKVSVETMNRAAKERYFLSSDEKFYRIDIADNGIGFDPEYEGKIFQIFQRLHGKSEYPGTGIGLSICKRIAEQHNGFILATGKVGMGAVFSIFLPENQS